MTDAWGKLHVEVLEDEIIITLPFTNYTVTYYKPATSPGLLAKNFPTKDDSRVSLTQASNGPGSSPTTRCVRSGDRVEKRPHDQQRARVTNRVGWS